MASRRGLWWGTKAVHIPHSASTATVAWVVQATQIAEAFYAFMWFKVHTTLGHLRASPTMNKST